MLSAAEKKLVFVGSAAVVALLAVCSGVLIAVKGDKPKPSEVELVEPPKGEFPMRYFQTDRRNYVSEDGNLAVIGPNWSKPRVKDGKEFYPIVVLHKSGEAFLEPYILNSELKDGGKDGNFTLECENVVLSERGEGIVFSYSDGTELITVNLRLVSAEE